MQRFREIFVTIFAIIILMLSVRGNPSILTENSLNSLQWKEEGPFELSPERGRFALTYSIVENSSFAFSLPIARFVTPDLGYINGQYVSLFAPGVSYLVIPGYLIGKLFAYPQLGAYAVIAIFGLVNAILVALLAYRLGAGRLASLIGGLVFIFATPAYAYSVNLYQHHISTFLVLMGVHLVIRYRSLFSLAIVFFISAMSIPIDYPNLFLMLPIGLMALSYVITASGSSRNQFRLHLDRLLMGIVILIPLSFFLWFNNRSYGNPLQFSGTIPSVEEIGSDGLPATPSALIAIQKNLAPNESERDAVVDDKSAVLFFDSRELIEGFYTHLLSPDRGIIVFAPLMIIGIIGLFHLNRRSPRLALLLSSIIVSNLILYSLWGDPWGGWAFGSRYLIPSYALLSASLAVYLQAKKNSLLVLTGFLIVAGYSVYVNTAGALSTSANPPQVQVLMLEELSSRRERYSFDRNIEYLRSGKSKSFAYQKYFAHKLNAWDYFRIIAASISAVILILVISLYLSKSKNTE